MEKDVATEITKKEQEQTQEQEQIKDPMAMIEAQNQLLDELKQEIKSLKDENHELQVNLHSIALRGNSSQTDEHKMFDIFNKY